MIQERKYNLRYQIEIFDRYIQCGIVSGLIIKTPLDHFIHPPFRAHKKAF